MVKCWVIGGVYIWTPKGGDRQPVRLRSGPGPFGYRGVRRSASAPPLVPGPAECEVEPLAGGAPFYIPAVELSPEAETAKPRQSR